MSPMRAQRQAAAFTLLELLVVMAIVALLVAMLLPALAKSRDAVRAVQCQARIRDVYFVCENYSNDSRDFLCSSNIWQYSPSAYPPGSSRDFYSQLRRYLPRNLSNWGYGNTYANSLLYCPSEKVIMPAGTALPPTYYADSIAAGLAWASGVACYWTNGRLGYGNIDVAGVTLPKKRAAAKPNQIYLGELRGNDAGTFGFWDFSKVKYRHSSSTVGNFVQVDGHVRPVRTPVTAVIASGELAW